MVGIPLCNLLNLQGRKLLHKVPRWFRCWQTASPYHYKTAQDAEKYLEAYEKMGGRPRDQWKIEECTLYGCVDNVRSKVVEKVKYEKGRYRVPYLDACDDIKSWRVVIDYIEFPIFISQKFSNRKESVSYFEGAVNYCKEHQLKYKMLLIQGCRCLLDING